MTYLVYFTLIGLTTLMIFRRPGVAIGQLFVTYGLSQWCFALNGWFLMHSWHLNAITSCMLCLGVVVALTKGKPVFRLPREYWAFLGIYVFTFMSAMWAVNPAKGLELMLKNLPNMFVFGFLPPLILTDREELKAMLYTILISGGIICLLLLTTTQWDERSIRFDTSVIFSEVSAGNPLAVASIGSNLALVALLLNFRAARIWKVLQFTLFGVGLALAVKSGSRGQALAVVFVALVLYPFSRRIKDIKGFIGFAFALTALGTITYYTFQIITAQAIDQNRWSADRLADASGARVAYSAEMIGHWLQGGPLTWIMGLGVGSSYKWLGIYPHVVLVEVLVEMGLVGLAFLIVFFAINITSIRSLWAYVRDDAQERGMVTALLGLFLFDFLLSFKQGAFLGSMEMFALGVYFARLLAEKRQEVELLAQLDAGGYAMSEADRAREMEDVEDWDAEAYPDAIPAQV